MLRRTTRAFQAAPQKLGPLAQLIGTWKTQDSVPGLNVIAVPSPGKLPTDDAAFTLLNQTLRETTSFENKAFARNRGGLNEQMNGSTEYNQQIWDAQTNETLHLETGMYLYLDSTTLNPADGGSKGDQPYKPPFQIARSGTIPHGNSIMILGDSVTEDATPTFSEWSSIDSTMQNVRLGYTDKYLGPPVPPDVLGYRSAPYAYLQKINQDLVAKGVKFTSITKYSLSSENQGGLLNTPFITKFANASKVDFELSHQVLSDGTERLQYQQRVMLDFTINPNTKKIISWPHITVNTLVKQ